MKFESEFQTISSGGAISYVEIPNMRNNLSALESLIKYMYNNIQYAEVNTKSDYCHECGFDGEIMINDDNEWECPNCGNKVHSKMSVSRRTCGYLGENFWNVRKDKRNKSKSITYVVWRFIYEENTYNGHTNYSCRFNTGSSIVFSNKKSKQQ